MPSTFVCSTTLPYAAFAPGSPPADATLVHISARDSLCNSGSFYVDFNTSTRNASVASNWGGCPIVLSQNSSRCVSYDDKNPVTDMCRPTSSNAVPFLRSAIVGCYCQEVGDY